MICIISAKTISFFPTKGRCLVPWYPLMQLTAHNWQKWKRVFLTCPCHEIYRVEAVGLISSNYT